MKHSDGYKWSVGLSDAMLGSGPWQLGEMGQKYMKTIKTSSLHLASLISDILDAAAASKGKLAIKLEKVCVCPWHSCAAWIMLIGMYKLGCTAWIMLSGIYK